MLVSNTSTEGRVYQMSSEHHVRYEVQLHNVSNWRDLRAANRRGARRGRLRAAARNRRLQQHHGRQLSHLSRDQLVSAVPLGDQGFRLEEHPLPQHTLLQQQQGLVRQRGLRPDARRRDPAARVRLADAFRQRARGACQSGLPGAGARREGGETGGRLLQHLRRRGGSRRRLLLRGRALAAHLPLVGGDAPGFDGARQSARPDQPGLRQSRQPDGGVVRRATGRSTRSSPASADRRHHAS